MIVSRLLFHYSGNKAAIVSKIQEQSRIIAILRGNHGRSYSRIYVFMYIHFFRFVFYSLLFCCCCCFSFFRGGGVAFFIYLIIVINIIHVSRNSYKQAQV